MKVREVEARSVLNRSGIPGADYALNPYLGCGHGCVYCYASFMKRFSGHDEAWGAFVDVKVNAPIVLARQLRRLQPAARQGAGGPPSGPGPAPGPQVLVGTVTDGYQPVEARYGVTRRCLEELARADWLRVEILTKSDLVVRDLDLLRGRPGWDVGFTITTASDEVSRLFEPGAAPSSRRFEAARALTRAGVGVWAFVGPALPGVCDSLPELSRLFWALAGSGVRRVLVDRFNPYPAARARLLRVVRSRFPRALGPLVEALREPEPYCRALAEAAGIAARKAGLELEVCFDADRPGRGTVEGVRR
ncbi:MAG: hypothetical protein K6T75_08145 [Acetobacteraceae bacterium]|nr:hypothetical protein [Acetobacteraceae bacterium]